MNTSKWTAIAGYPINTENQYRLWAMGAPREIVEANLISAELIGCLPNPFIKKPTKEEIQKLIKDTTEQSGFSG